MPSPIPIGCFQAIADHTLVCQLQSCLAQRRARDSPAGPPRPIRSSFLRSRVFTAICAMQRESSNPALAGQCHNHPLPRQVLFAPGRAGGEHFAPRLRPHGYTVRDPVALELLQRSTLFIVHRQVQMITLLISAQPSLAGRPRRSRYRATRSLIVATKALSSLDVGALAR